MSHDIRASWQRLNGAKRSTFNLKNRKALKTRVFAGVCVILGVVSTLVVLPVARQAITYFGPPRVTLMNATGKEISDVTVILGTVTNRMPDLKDGHARTIEMSGRFGECSTRIGWTDTEGRHAESAGDYMESCGFYHAKIVLTPDRKAKAIYEMKESNRLRH